MKKILFILIIIPFASYSQDQMYNGLADNGNHPASARSIKPFKKANTIIINTDMSFKEVARHLSRQGFTVDNFNEDIGTLTTKPKTIKKKCAVSLNAFQDGNTVTLTGNYSLEYFNSFSMSFDDMSSQVDFGGMKGSPRRIAWDALYEAAMTVSNDLEFAKQ